MLHKFRDEGSSDVVNYRRAREHGESNRLVLHDAHGDNGAPIHVRRNDFILTTALRRKVKLMTRAVLENVVRAGDVEDIEEVVLDAAEHAPGVGVLLDTRPSLDGCAWGHPLQLVCQRPVDVGTQCVELRISAR